MHVSAREPRQRPSGAERSEQTGTSSGRGGGWQPSRRPVAAPHPGRPAFVAPDTGPSPPSSWTFGFLCLEFPPHPARHTRAHTHTARCTHTCMCIHTPTCTQACPRAHTSTYMHTQAHTSSSPWPFGPQLAACPPAGLRASQRRLWPPPRPVFLPSSRWPPHEVVAHWRVFLCHRRRCQLRAVSWCPGWAQQVLVQWAEEGTAE